MLMCVIYSQNERNAKLRDKSITLIIDGMDQAKANLPLTTHSLRRCNKTF